MNAREMILWVRDVSPVTPATKQRRAGRLSVCQCLTAAPCRGGASSQTQVPAENVPAPSSTRCYSLHLSAAGGRRYKSLFIATVELNNEAHNDLFQCWELLLEQQPPSYQHSLAGDALGWVSTARGEELRATARREPAEEQRPAEQCNPGEVLVLR